MPQLTRQLEAEGVRRIVVLADDPGKYPPGERFAVGVEILPRERLDAVQRELRTAIGVTALVYDQTCAAEKRRRRKRTPATVPAPAPVRRIFINEMVCEGCGDCCAQIELPVGGSGCDRIRREARDRPVHLQPGLSVA